MIFQDGDSSISYWGAKKTKILNLNINQQRIKEGSKKVNDYQGNSGARETLFGFRVCENT